MVPADTNNALAEGMLNELSSSVPIFARGFFKRLVICMMDERMRLAMKYVACASQSGTILTNFAARLPAQPRWLHGLISISAAVTRFTGRYLLPPRSRPSCVVPIKSSTNDENNEKLARMHPFLCVTDSHLRRHLNITNPHL